MNQNTDQPDKVRTITLSDRDPVRIHENEWPILSSSRDAEEEGGEWSKWWLTVRRHADGRTLVYGRLETTLADGSVDKIVGGDLLEKNANAALSVRKIGEECHCSRAMIARCIAGLPAEDI
jgi:hypothetical protein